MGELYRSIDALPRPNAPPPLPVSDWRVAQTTPFSVLIVSADDNAIDATVTKLLEERSRQPTCWWSHGSQLPVRGAHATVVIRDVVTLSLEQQQAWLSWLNQEDGFHPKVITTSSIDVYPLVSRGVFLSALYYKLNTVLLNL